MGMVVHDLIPVLKSQRRADLGEFQALSQKKKVIWLPVLHYYTHLCIERGIYLTMASRLETSF